MQEYTGHLQGKGLRIALVAARFNELITKNLVEGAIDALRRHGVEENHISLTWVPGAFEIPLAAKAFAESAQFDAVVCLGAVIRGATPHFDYVCSPLASNIAKLSLEYSMPIIFAVLTTNTVEEAFERAGSKAGNKGFDGAVAAIEMANLLKALNKK